MEHCNLLAYLKKELAVIDAAIVHMEESDHASHRDYTRLVKTKKIVLKAMKKLKRLDENICNFKGILRRKK